MKNHVLNFSRVSLSVLLVIFTVPAAFFFNLKIADAATYTVASNGSSPNDSNCSTSPGSITLTEAVACANANSGADIITIPATGTIGGPIVLGGGISISAGEDLTINGAGSASTAITAGGIGIAGAAFDMSGVALTISGTPQYAIAETDAYTGDFVLDDVAITGTPSIGVWVGYDGADGYTATGNVSITNSSISASSASILIGLSGGGSPTTAAVVTGNVTITGNDIATAPTGGGLNSGVTFFSATVGGSVVVSDNTFTTGGTVGLSGIAAMDMNGLSATLQNVTIYNNVMNFGASQIGAGIAVLEPSGGAIDINGNTITGLVDQDANLGGGILAADFLCLTGDPGCVGHDDVVIIGNTIDLTYEADPSFGVVMSGATVSQFGANNVNMNNENGAALQCTGGSAATVSCSISENIVNKAGVIGIVAAPSQNSQTLTVDIFNNAIMGQTTPNANGIIAGAYPLGGPPASGLTLNGSIYNNSIDGNGVATGIIAGDIAGDSAGAINVFNNAVQNYDTVAGAGIVQAASGGTTTFDSDYNIVGPDSATAYATFDGMAFSDLTEGANDIIGDADFTDPSTADLSLLPSSDAIDIGINTFNGKPAPATDIEYTSRPQLGGYDAGAYEALTSNTAPTANAGADQYTSINEVNTLDCSSSTDPELDSLTYWWTQTSGTPAWVTLSSNAAAAPTFTPTTFGDYNFQCQAIDPSALSDTDTVTVHATAKRVAGASNRYETAVEISQERFSANSVSAMVIASGENYPDALAAGPLASLIGGPILLVEQDWAPAETRAEISRIWNDVDDAATDVYIIGGTAAVNAYVKSQIQAVDTRLDIEVVAGAADRIDTAIKIAQKMETLRGNNATVFALASGYNFNDAAAMSGPASDSSINSRRIPILLTTNNTSLDSRVSSYMNSEKAGVTRVWIVGTTGAVSSSAQTSVNSIFGTSNVTRLAGSNAYGTSAAIATQFYGSSNSPDDVAVTTGLNFPDVLAGGPLAGYLHMPIVYSNNSTVDSTITTYLNARASTLSKVYVFGGTSAISNSIKQTVQAGI